ncbi:hypothetical protein J2W28_000236 [Variovorax boronicumulans]|uniref:hypothetical protein n=1 Tax=Variovorax boronicumulans TaxID=436515 RepID=UPI002785EA57|nr:hypothetical protein [Variovorax boronicumulans]MDP9990381.1 hypothetical protein [Variovorax boronicumulans]MDQ0001108.1 hypothetical protein [Variovorax boronicumulans]
MTNDVHQHALNWLNTSGFPLEMIAAAAFRNVGFHVQQSAIYEDAQSSKGREIDVLASDPDIWGYINLSAVVECKSSTNPWVVFISDDNSLQSIRTSAVMTKKAESVLWEKRMPLNRASQGASQAPLGYGFRQVAKDGKDGKDKKSNVPDPAYAAAMNVLSACKGLVDSAPTFPDTEAIAISIPIIVVNSPILECQLDANKKLQLTSVEQSRFLFSAYLPQLTRCVIQVVHQDALEEKAKEAKTIVNDFRSDLQSEQDALFATYTAKAAELQQAKTQPPETA